MAEMRDEALDVFLAEADEETFFSGTAE